jgi:DNA polymerase III delta prime subunit
MTRLLLCGMPGAGKTTTGDLLAELGWSHFDCETKSEIRWRQNPARVFPDRVNVVASWGFLPREVETVQKFLDLGFLAVWMWSGRDNLLRALSERGEKDGFLDRPSRANQADGLRLINADMVLNTFRIDGCRWDVANFLHNVYWQADDAG